MSARPGPSAPAVTRQAASRRPRVTRAALILVLFVHAAVAAGQPVLAGIFLSGGFDAIGIHGILGSALAAWCMVQGVVTFLFWRPGHGPWWPFVATVVLFFVEGFQIGMGYASQLAIHVPLGVAIAGVTVAMFVWSLVWRPGTTRDQR